MSSGRLNFGYGVLPRREENHLLLPSGWEAVPVLKVCSGASRAYQEDHRALAQARGSSLGRRAALTKHAPFKWVRKTDPQGCRERPLCQRALPRGRKAV